MFLHGRDQGDGRRDFEVVLMPCTRCTAWRDYFVEQMHRDQGGQ